MHPPRLRTFSYVGMYTYFLTLCTEQRHRWFVSEEVVSTALSQFRQSADASRFALVAYCFMPDHLHLLCEATSDSADLLTCIGAAKQRSAYLHSKTVGGRLWQKGFYDHVLRAEAPTLAVVRYIVSNPVRSGLASRIGEYRFCGSDRYSLEDIVGCQEMWNPPRARQP